MTADMQAIEQDLAAESERLAEKGLGYLEFEMLRYEFPDPEEEESDTQ